MLEEGSCVFTMRFIYPELNNSFIPLKIKPHNSKTHKLNTVLSIGFMSNKTEKSVVLYRYFPKDIAYTVLFTEVVSINYKNLISILEQFSKEMESCFLGPV